MKRLVLVQALDGHRLQLRFNDGVEGVVDLSPPAGKGVFAAWNDPSHFVRVHVSIMGAAEWERDIDRCPDQLYMQLTGKTVREIFPNWRAEAAHA
jgi:hypothetical protein